MVSASLDPHTWLRVQWMSVSLCITRQFLFCLLQHFANGDNSCAQQSCIDWHRHLRCHHSEEQAGERADHRSITEVLV